MYEVPLIEGEILNYNKLVKIEMDNSIHIIGLVITNMHIMLFESGKKDSIKDILNSIKYKTNYAYKRILKEKIKDIECSFINGNTVIKTKEKTFHVLGEKVPIPIL